jgi:hypothetical protein
MLKDEDKLNRLLKSVSFFEASTNLFMMTHPKERKATEVSRHGGASN